MEKDVWLVDIVEYCILGLGALEQLGVKVDIAHVRDSLANRMDLLHQAPAQHLDFHLYGHWDSAAICECMNKRGCKYFPQIYVQRGVLLHFLRGQIAHSGLNSGMDFGIGSAGILNGVCS